DFRYQIDEWRYVTEGAAKHLAASVPSFDLIERHGGPALFRALDHGTLLRKGTTVPAAGREQNFAHSSMSPRRFQIRSPRRYARSTALPIACASACSTTWFGNAVVSAAQSRKVERKPWTVMSVRPMRASTSANTLSPSLRPACWPMNT